VEWCRRAVIAVAATVALVALLPGCSRSPQLPAPCRTARPPKRGLRVTSTCTARVAVPPAAVDLTDIVFTDAGHGWAAGTSCPAGVVLSGCPGVVERTVDGGSSWTASPTGSWVLSRLTFVDDLHGWAVGDSARCPLLATGCPEAVLTTGDGGATWSVAYRIDSGISGIAAVSPVAAWVGLRGCPDLPEAAAACPGSVLATTDGGVHWRRVLRVEGAIVALNAAAGTLRAVQESPLTVWSSQDGAGWVPVASTVSFVPEPLDSTAAASLTFSGPEDGWLTVFQQDSCAMHGCPVATVFGTLDGGHTWVAPVVARSGPPDGCGWSQPASALAPDGTLFVAAGVNLGACQPPESALYRLQSGVLRPVHDFALGALVAMAWLSPTDGWASTAAAIVHTSDGGTTWTQVLPAPTPVGDVAFTNPLDGWGVATSSDADAVLATVDGGRTWRVVSELAGPAGLIAASGPYLWVVDLRVSDWVPSILRSADGGRTWAPTYTLPSSPIGPPGVEAISMSGADGVVVSTDSSGGWLLRGAGSGPVQSTTTTDSGRTWRSGPPLPPGIDVGGPGLVAAGFEDPDRGWAAVAGRGGEVLDTTADGGATWRPAGLLPSDMADGPSTQSGVDDLDGRFGWVWSGFPDDRHGAMAILATADGGRTWRRDDLGGVAPGETPSEVVFIDPEHGWLVTGDGFWTTDDGGLDWHLA
jgi:photosystem II stability/assembly factor-like uncharacterized protein